MSDAETSLNEVTYKAPVKSRFDPGLGKVVRTADVPGYEIGQLSGNPSDQGID